MARREPITDVHLRELALKRFRTASCEPAAPVGDSLKNLLDEIAADRDDATINAIYEEIELYRTSKLISKHAGPDSVAESLRLRVDVLKKAQQAILEMPAIPHASTPPDVSRYHAAHDALHGLINAAEAEIKRQNGQASPGKTKQRNTRLRNNLAVGLKGIAIGLGKGAREAERWVEQVFDALKQDHPDPSDLLHVMYPDPREHPGDFKRMFTVTVC